MPFQPEVYTSIKNEIGKDVSIIAVSKFQPVSAIEAAYQIGHRDFGENYVQELIEKSAQLPPDIRWHFIGHLQTNKIKYIAPFVHLIQGVDSLKLLTAINKEGHKLNIQINCLLQVHVAQESTKFGFDNNELNAIHATDFPNIRFAGIMGMATFTDDQSIIKKDFQQLHHHYETLKKRFSTFEHLSMGMSADYSLAIECGSNMIRIGSVLFGERPQK